LSQKKTLDKVKVPVYTIRFKCSFCFFVERAFALKNHWEGGDGCVFAFNRLVLLQAIETGKETGNSKQEENE